MLEFFLVAQQDMKIPEDNNVSTLILGPDWANRWSAD